MLGAVVGRRRCAWFSPTGALLAHVFRSNTTVQSNYRLPLLASTHDAECGRKDCVTPAKHQKQLLVAQRAMTQMSGYFGGYISKRQKMGQFELTRSIGDLPLMQEKLEGAA